MTAHAVGVAGQSSRFGSERLYRDAAALASSSVVNAVLGMVFWAVCARVIPVDRLGVMTAVLAVLTAPALVVASGAGDAYGVLLPAVGRARIAVFRHGQRLFLAISSAAGALAGLACVTLLPEVRGSIPIAVLVLVGTVVWAAFAIQQNTLTSIGRARWLPAASVAAGLGRIALLPLLAGSLSWQSVEVATLGSAAVVVVVLTPLTHRIITTSAGLPDDYVMSDAVAVAEFNRFVTRTLIAVALTLGISMLSPFIVTVASNPREGALFALSSSITQLLDFVGVALTVSLVVHASSRPAEAPAMARAILRKTLLLTIGGAGVIIAFAPLGLQLLNPQYDDGASRPVIALLCLAGVIRTGYLVWSAMERSRREMKKLLTLNAFGAVVMLITVAPLAAHIGAIGGAIGVLSAQSVLTGGSLYYALTARRRDIAVSEATQ